MQLVGAFSPRWCCHQRGCKKVKHLLDGIDYSIPTDQIITDVTDVKIVLNNKTIYHKIDFGRGQSENVDSLIDYLSELLDYKVAIYGFTELSTITQMN